MAACYVPLYLWSISEPDARESARTLELLGSIGTYFNYVNSVVWGGTMVTYLMWLHRVVRQVNAWGHDVGATPAWAVGCWFVPLVGLLKPYRVVQSIVEGLGGKALAESLHVGIWWLAFFLSGLLTRVAELMSTRMLDPSLALQVYVLELGSIVLTVVSAVLCIRIVREVQSRLEIRRSGL